MRWHSTFAAFAVLLAAGSARAQQDGPGEGPSGGFGASESEHMDVDSHVRESQRPGEKADQKKWEVEGVWETHRMVRQEDVEGYADNKTVNVAFLYLRYDFTKYDRVWLRGGMYERFMSDQTESGFRADDTVAAYTRTVPLPEKFTFKATGQLSAPTSFISQKEGLITEPRITVSLEKKLGRFTLQARTFGGVHWMRYTTAEGGNPNPKWLWVASVGAEYKVPLVEMLSLGISATNQYLWLYEPGYNANAPNSERYGVATDPNYGNKQPVQQAYGLEAYARYTMPDFVGIKSDLTVSYAQGDPSLGFTSALHDGSRHVYPLFWRHTSTVYAALSVAY